MQIPLRDTCDIHNLPMRCALAFKRGDEARISYQHLNEFGTEHYGSNSQHLMTILRRMAHYHGWQLTEPDWFGDLGLRIRPWLGRG